MHLPHTILDSLLHVSGVHGGAERSARRVKNMEKCSKWPKMRKLMAQANGVHVRLRPDYAPDLRSTPMCPTYPLGSDQIPLDLGMTGSPSEPMSSGCPEWLTR